MPALASRQGTSVMDMSDQGIGTSRLVNRSGTDILCSRSSPAVSQLVRTDSIPPGVLLSPMSEPTDFSDSVGSIAETDSSIRASFTPIPQKCLIGGCAAEVDDSEIWCLSLSYSHTDEFLTVTPRRTFKGFTPNRKCRVSSVTVPRSSDRCNLFAT